FTRMSVRGKSKVHNEMGFALMAVNLRKYTVTNNENGTFSHKNKRKNGCVYLLLINTTVFVYLRLVMSQPLFMISMVISLYQSMYSLYSAHKSFYEILTYSFSGSSA